MIASKQAAREVCLYEPQQRQGHAATLRGWNTPGAAHHRRPAFLPQAGRPSPPGTGPAHPLDLLGLCVHLCTQNVSVLMTVGTMRMYILMCIYERLQGNLQLVSLEAQAQVRVAGMHEPSLCSSTNGTSGAHGLSVLPSRR